MMEQLTASTSNSPNSSSSLTLTSNDLVESFIRDDLTDNVEEILGLITKSFEEKQVDLHTLRKISHMSYDDLPQLVRDTFDQKPHIEASFYSWQEKARDRLPSSDDSSSMLNDSYLTPNTPSPLTFPIALPLSHTKSYQMLKADGFIHCCEDSFSNFCENELICEGWVQHGDLNDIQYPLLGMGVEAMEPNRFSEIDSASQTSNSLPSKDSREAYLNAFEIGFTDISRFIKTELVVRQELGIRVYINSIIRLLLLNGLYLYNKPQNRFENAKKYYTSNYQVDLSAFKHQSFGSCQPDFVARYPESAGDMGIVIIGNYASRENDDDFSVHERGKLIDYLTCLLQYIQTERTSAIGFLTDGYRFQFIKANLVDKSYYTFEESKIFTGLNGWQKIFALLSKDFHVLGYEPLVLSNWMVESFLGRGGAGEVFSVLKKDAAKKRCVLKKFLFHETGFERELHALKMFQQCQIQRYIPIFEEAGHFPDSGLPYIISYPCGNMMSPVKRDSPWIFNSKHMIDLIDLLEVVHEDPIKSVHRDIKPHNIFIHNEDVVLADWGLASTIGIEVPWAGTDCYADPIYLQTDVDKHLPSPEEDLRTLVRTFFVFYRQIEPVGDPIPFWQKWIRLNDPREIQKLSMKTHKRKHDAMENNSPTVAEEGGRLGEEEVKHSIWSKMMIAASARDYGQLVQLCRSLDDSF